MGTLWTDTNYTVVGTSQLVSVPYALYSKAAGLVADAVTITGNQTITGIKTFSNDLNVNGLTIGKGKNSVAFNTAFGANGLKNNTTGDNNTAVGFDALFFNTEGTDNTANGQLSLYKNTIGSKNTATGSNTLSSNTIGNYNTATGIYALYSNTEGDLNTANGTNALCLNTTGDYNTATGSRALYTNTTGNYNTASGIESLFSNTTGNYNTAWGSHALSKNTTGYENTAFGMKSLYSLEEGINNTAVGYRSGYLNITGNNNVFLGSSAGFFETGSNKLFIDNQGRENEADARKKALMYGVFDADPANQILAVNGKLGINTITPQCPLDVNGAATLGTLTYGYLNKDGLTGKYTASPNYSIRAAWSILAAEFHAISDARVKNIYGLANNHQNLELLENLEVINFSYIDTYSYGNQAKYGFVAQEVEKILPEAINKSSEFIPDVFCSATEFAVDNSQQIKIKLGKPHNFSDGDVVRLYLDRQMKESPVRVLSDTDFIVDGVSEEPEFVFVYGKQVKDFCTLDYDQIFTLGIGAIQELSRQNKSLKNDIAVLNSENSDLNKEVLKLKADNNSIREEIDQLKSLRKEFDNLKRIVRRRVKN